MNQVTFVENTLEQIRALTEQENLADSTAELWLSITSHLLGECDELRETTCDPEFIQKLAYVRLIGGVRAIDRLRSRGVLKRQYQHEGIAGETDRSITVLWGQLMADIDKYPQSL